MQVISVYNKVSYTFKKYIVMPESRALIQVENII